MTPDVRLLRDAAYYLRLSIWDGSQPAPEPVLLTELERTEAEAAKPKRADLMTPDEMLARLGLKRPGEEVPDD